MRKLSCEEIKSLLSDKAAGCPDESLAGALELHLNDCDECRAYAAELEGLAEGLEKLESVEPSSSFDMKLYARLHGEKAVQKATAFTIIAAYLKRLRHIELGAAVYPLTLICIAYIMWSFISPRKELSVEPRFGGPHGQLLLVYEEPELNLIAIDKAISQRPDLHASVADPYKEPLPDVPLPAFEPLPITTEIAVELPPQRREPSIDDFQHFPEPPRMIVPSGGPGGTTLASSRFSTIRNSPSHLRIAISQGIQWLSRNQREDGSWQAGEAARAGYTDVEITSAATLAMMQAGFTASGRDETSLSVRKSLMWLVKQQKPDGTFAAGPRKAQAQAFASIALCEGLRLSDREILRARFRPAIQQAVTALLRMQSDTGAWGGDDPEMTALALMATGSARAAGLSIEQETYDKAIAWLDNFREEMTSPELAAVEPKAGTVMKSVTYAAIGKAALFVDRSGGESVQKSVTDLVNAPIVWESGDFFRWYGATLAAYRLSGENWQNWRTNLLVELIGKQAGMLVKGNTPEQGSWPPHGICRESGRTYTTAMAILTLTASCGHSPLYGGSK